MYEQRRIEFPFLENRIRVGLLDPGPGPLAAHRARPEHYGRAQDRLDEGVQQSLIGSCLACVGTRCLRMTIYDWLIGHGRGDGFDAHVFACAIAARCVEEAETLPELLGLDDGAFDSLLTAFFPGVSRRWDRRLCFKVYAHRQVRAAFRCRCRGFSAAAGGTVEHAPELRVHSGSVRDPIIAEEERDLRNLLLEHRALGVPEEEWLASILARGALRANHLWQDVGVHDRREVSEILRRHFPALHARNTGNMRWKKFLYKQLCDRAGLRICKAPNCEVCHDYPICFGPEEGAAALPRVQVPHTANAL